MKTQLLSQTQISQASELLLQGEIVGLPTETVYGLGANGLNPSAVENIFTAKGRPQDNPLILHLGETSWLSRYCIDIPDVAWELAEHFWPGPLTMILKRNPVVPDIVTAGLDTVGVRCPDHRLCRDVILQTDRPVAAPSGNTSGKPSPTTSKAMLEDMDGKIPAILEGGACRVGVESTIIDLTSSPVCVLRYGGITMEQLERVLGTTLKQETKAENAPKAPGMKYRHYAPRASMTVVVGEGSQSADYIQKHLKQGEGVLCFTEYKPLFSGFETCDIGKENDFTQQGKRVFEALRAFDKSEVNHIWAQCPPERELGVAVANRLQKAASFQVVTL